MNLANKITLFRVLLIPVFLTVFLSPLLDEPLRRHVAFAVFVIACASDFLDGYIARSRNMITTFGKFADPLADKLLVVSALVALVQLQNLPAWIVVIIISREFMVTGLRLVAAAENIVIAASFWGKIKTVSQMLMITYLLLGFSGIIYEAIGGLLITLAVVFTVISGIEYFIKNINVLVSR